MKIRILLLFFLIIAANDIVAQKWIMDNKSNFSLTQLTVIYHGTDIKNSEEFQYQTLLSDVSRSSHYKLNYKHRFAKNIFANSDLIYSKFEKEMNNSYKGKYNGYSINQIGVFIGIGYCTRFAEKGIYNRLKPWSNLSVGIHSTTVRIPNGITTEVHTNGVEYSPSVTSEIINLGINGAIGIDYSLNNFFYVNLGVNNSFSFVKSNFFSERIFNFCSLQIGVGLRFGNKFAYKYI